MARTTTDPALLEDRCHDSSSTVCSAVSHRGQSARVRRFVQPFNQGSLENVVENLFGIDAGSRVGIEYRFGLFPGTQVGMHRTSDRTIQFFAQTEVLAQGSRSPVDVHAIAAIDGTNNMRGFATTLPNVMRGAPNADDWYLGFAISRKFY